MAATLSEWLPEAQVGEVRGAQADALLRFPSVS